MNIDKPTGARDIPASHSSGGVPPTGPQVTHHTGPAIFNGVLQVTKHAKKTTLEMLLTDDGKKSTIPLKREVRLRLQKERGEDRLHGQPVTCKIDQRDIASVATVQMVDEAGEAFGTAHKIDIGAARSKSLRTFVEEYQGDSAPPGKERRVGDGGKQVTQVIAHPQPQRRKTSITSSLAALMLESHPALANFLKEHFIDTWNRLRHCDDKKFDHPNTAYRNDQLEADARFMASVGDCVARHAGSKNLRLDAKCIQDMLAPAVNYVAGLVKSSKTTIPDVLKQLITKPSFDFPAIAAWKVLGRLERKLDLKAGSMWRVILFRQKIDMLVDRKIPATPVQSAAFELRKPFLLPTARAWEAMCDGMGRELDVAMLEEWSRILGGHNTQDGCFPRFDLQACLVEGDNWSERGDTTLRDWIKKLEKDYGIIIKVTQDVENTDALGKKCFTYHRYHAKPAVLRKALADAIADYRNTLAAIPSRMLRRSGESEARLHAAWVLSQKVLVLQPFADGNTRLANMLLFRELAAQGEMPAVLHNPNALFAYHVTEGVPMVHEGQHWYAQQSLDTVFPKRQPGKGSEVVSRYADAGDPTRCATGVSVSRIEIREGDSTDRNKLAPFLFGKEFGQLTAAERNRLNDRHRQIVQDAKRDLDAMIKGDMPPSARSTRVRPVREEDVPDHESSLVGSLGLFGISTAQSKAANPVYMLGLFAGEELNTTIERRAYAHCVTPEAYSAYSMEVRADSHEEGHMLAPNRGGNRLQRANTAVKSDGKIDESRINAIPIELNVWMIKDGKEIKETMMAVISNSLKGEIRLDYGPYYQLDRLNAPPPHGTTSASASGKAKDHAMEIDKPESVRKLRSNAPVNRQQTLARQVEDDVAEVFPQAFRTLLHADDALPPQKAFYNQVDLNEDHRAMATLLHLLESERQVRDLEPTAENLDLLLRAGLAGMRRAIREDADLRADLEKWGSPPDGFLDELLNGAYAPHAKQVLQRLPKIARRLGISVANAMFLVIDKSKLDMLAERGVPLHDSPFALWLFDTEPRYLERTLAALEYASGLPRAVGSIDKLQVEHIGKIGALLQGREGNTFATKPAGFPISEGTNGLDADGLAWLQDYFAGLNKTYGLRIELTLDDKLTRNYGLQTWDLFRYDGTYEQLLTIMKDLLANFKSAIRAIDRQHAPGSRERSDAVLMAAADFIKRMHALHPMSDANYRAFVICLLNVVLKLLGERPLVFPHACAFDGKTPRGLLPECREAQGVLGKAPAAAAAAAKAVLLPADDDSASEDEAAPPAGRRSTANLDDIEDRSDIEDVEMEDLDDAARYYHRADPAQGDGDRLPLHHKKASGDNCLECTVETASGGTIQFEPGQFPKLLERQGAPLDGKPGHALPELSRLYARHFGVEKRYLGITLFTPKVIADRLAASLTEVRNRDQENEEGYKALEVTLRKMAHYDDFFENFPMWKSAARGWVHGKLNDTKTTVTIDGAEVNKLDHLKDVIDAAFEAVKRGREMQDRVLDALDAGVRKFIIMHVRHGVDYGVMAHYVCFRWLQEDIQPEWVCVDNQKKDIEFISLKEYIRQKMADSESMNGIEVVIDNDVNDPLLQLWRQEFQDEHGGSDCVFDYGFMHKIYDADGKTLPADEDVEMAEEEKFFQGRAVHDCAALIRRAVQERLGNTYGGKDDIDNMRMHLLGLFGNDYMISMSRLLDMRWNDFDLGAGTMAVRDKQHRLTHTVRLDELGKGVVLRYKERIANGQPLETVPGNSKLFPDENWVRTKFRETRYCLTDLPFIWRKLLQTQAIEDGLKGQIFDLLDQHDGIDHNVIADLMLDASLFEGMGLDAGDIAALLPQYSSSVPPTKKDCVLLRTEAGYRIERRQFRSSGSVASVTELASVTEPKLVAMLGTWLRIRTVRHVDIIAPSDSKNSGQGRVFISSAGLRAAGGDVRSIIEKQRANPEVFTKAADVVPSDTGWRQSIREVCAMPHVKVPGIFMELVVSHYLSDRDAMNLKLDDVKLKQDDPARKATTITLGAHRIITLSDDEAGLLNAWLTARQDLVEQSKKCKSDWDEPWLFLALTKKSQGASKITKSLVGKVRATLKQGHEEKFGVRKEFFFRYEQAERGMTPIQRLRSAAMATFADLTAMDANKLRTLNINDISVAEDGSINILREVYSSVVEEQRQIIEEWLIVRRQIVSDASANALWLDDLGRRANAATIHEACDRKKVAAKQLESQVQAEDPAAPEME